MVIKIPDYLKQWFASRGWKLHPYQRAMLDCLEKKRSTLLIAPTGGGKTLAGFLPSLVDIARTKPKGLHTIYISPLKALANDIQRNLLAPVAEMELPVRVESRTGDTTASVRARQRKKPPHILLTTPESLMLMLSYTEAPDIFGSVKAIIVDEVHSLAPSKRGDFTALAIEAVQRHSPDAVRIGLSATVAEPEPLAAWLGNAVIQKADYSKKPDVEILTSKGRIPYGGHMAQYAMPEVYAAISKAKTSLVFVNTRAQAELIFQALWQLNEANLPIGIYHGSLSKQQRSGVEKAMAAGQLRAVVSTSALELGVDWGDVDLVIQIGAPKGVARLMQRIGRSNHNYDTPSKALLVPSNRFEAIECDSALRAIAAGQMDGETPDKGSLDVVVQYIINCACSAPVTIEWLYAHIRNAYPYRELSHEHFVKLFQFAIHGGNVLEHYDRFARLVTEDGEHYKLAGKMVARRHRMNIGTIVEAGKIKIRRIGKRGGYGRVIGEVEENFIIQLAPGDSFIFAGQMLRFEGLRDGAAIASAAPGDKPKIPSYNGGNMPLSSFLAQGVREILSDPPMEELPASVYEWLEYQRQFSCLPKAHEVLVESFKRVRLHYLIFYPFAGRRAHNTLGMLITRRMEHLGLKPVGFTVSDYAMAVSSLRPVEDPVPLLEEDILGAELEEWMEETPMLKRTFREVCTVAGLVEQRVAGAERTMRQVTFSTDLIYDVLHKHDPGHILLTMNRQEAERELLDLYRLASLLKAIQGNILFRQLPHASPLAIPVLSDVRKQSIFGAGIEEILLEASVEDDAEAMMQRVRESIALKENAA